jgi:putative ABC transport system permease protein
MANNFKRTFRHELVSRATATAAVEDELRHHIDLCVEELVEEGWDLQEAQREALRQFGDLQSTRAYCEEMQARREREERRTMSMDELWQDLRYALRSIQKAPGYAGLVVLTLAFGIAANTTIFSVMNPYLFRPLPYDSAEELVHVNQVNPVTGWEMDRFSYPQYQDWRTRARAFQDLAAYGYGSANVTDLEGPEQIQFSYLTSNMFDVLGAQAARGRTFRPEEGRPGGDQVVVMAHGLWERRYTSDPSIIGRTITMDGVQRTVIGVMPPDFNFPFGGVKLWVPIQEDAAAADRGRIPYQLVGRMNDGWTAYRVRAELAEIQSELALLYPDTDGRMSGVTVKPLREALNFAWDVVSVLFVVLFGAVAFVLLIACVNVASLTLARGSSRLREISVRAAMGARRNRIVRQLLTESMALALLGGAVGVAISYWITGILNPVVPEDLFKIGEIDIDGSVLAFSVAVTVLTPVAFGLVPALRASRADLTLGLKEGSKGSGGLATSRGRRILVVAQVTLAVALISGAGLMLRSFQEVQGIDLGFDNDRITTTEIILPTNEYPSAEERRAMMTELVAAVAARSDVQSASAVRWLPLNHEMISEQVAPPDMIGVPGEEWPLAMSNYVHPDYFETMGIELLAGRDFASTDGIDADRVAIVNRSLATRFWPDGNRVGQTLLAGDPDDPTTYLVVGVVADARHSDLNQTDIAAQVYLPTLQASARRFFVVARTPGQPSDAVPGIRSAIGSIAPTLPLAIRPMNAVVAENQLQWSLSSVFLAAFGAGALLLATLGIYGLISYSVEQRHRELGVRIALGATAAEIRQSVVGDALKLTGLGLALGLLVSLGLGQAISSVLYGVSPFDPVTLAGVLLLFVGASALAAFVPAARASGTNPIAVLRSE